MTTKNMYKRILDDGYINKSISIRSFYRYLSSNELREVLLIEKKEEDMKENILMMCGKEILHLVLI